MKTIEEAARECYYRPEYSDSYAAGKKSGFYEGVEFAQRWIPIEEELPKVGVLVLIQDEDKFRRLGFYNGEFWMNNYGAAVLHITHWRPINFE